MAQVSDTVFDVCDKLGDAVRRGRPLSLHDSDRAAARLRGAAMAIRAMEEALDGMVAEGRAVESARTRSGSFGP